MRADVAAIVSAIAAIVIIGLLVRFNSASPISATATGIQGILVELENPGRFEKVG